MPILSMGKFNDTIFHVKTINRKESQSSFKFSNHQKICYNGDKLKKVEKMQLSIDLKTKDIISLISQMSLNELEKVKNSLVERELYFKKFKKDNVEDIIDDFKKENYSDDFLTDLEKGLKKSSIYK